MDSPEEYEGKTTTFTVTVKQNEIDEDAPKIIVDSVSASAGKTVTVEARLENNPGISSVSLKIDYDVTRLKLESAQFGTELSNGAFTNYNLPYITLVRSDDCAEDVTLVTMTFSVLPDAEAGDAYVTLMYEEGDITNYDEDDVPFAVVSGGVTVIDYVPGDINGDGKVNSKDLTRLLKYISHEDVEVNEAALDVNGDGKVNSKDLTRLLKYISHEDVEIHVISRPKNNLLVSGTSPKMTVGSASAAPGETVEVTVNLENNPGISSAVLKIDYDEARLSLTSATIGEKFGTGAFTNVNLPYVTFVRSGDVAEDEVLLKLSFAINSDAQMGEAYVTILYEEGDITNYDEDDVNFEVVPGKIVVECGHATKTEVPAQKADCRNDGNHLYYVCDSCGLTFKADGVTETTVAEETIAALGHSFTNYVSNGDATCLNDGTKTAKCDRCDVTDSVSDEGSALGHDWDEGVVIIEPTMENEGEIRYTCNRCPETKTEVLPRLEHTHSYEAVVTAPTCTVIGYTTYICDCGENYIADEVDALGHKWNGTSCENCDSDRENPFADVPEGSFFINPVLWAVEYGITTGATETTFNPNGQCQRAQVVTFLWRAFGCPEPFSTDNPFVDVKETDFYYKAVLWAVENGITNGLDATHFGPFAYCNRAQVVTFLYRAMSQPQTNTTECPFTDVAAGAWYEKPVLWAVENGVTNGMGDGTFGVNGICNRAQVVTFLYRAFT